MWMPFGSTPDTRSTRGSNAAHCPAPATKRRTLSSYAAVTPIWSGAADQSLQRMNLMFGLPERLVCRRCRCRPERSSWPNRPPHRHHGLAPALIASSLACAGDLDPRRSSLYRTHWSVASGARSIGVVLLVLLARPVLRRI